MSGTLWKSETGKRYVLAAGSREVTSIRVSGGPDGPNGTAQGRRLMVSAKKGAKVKLSAQLSNGEKLGAPR